MKFDDIDKFLSVKKFSVIKKIKCGTEFNVWNISQFYKLIHGLLHHYF